MLSCTTQGRLSLWVLGVNSAPSNLFAGKKRRSHLVVQGQFKEPLSFDDVVTGQEFKRPLKKLPAMLLIKALLKVAASLSPGMMWGSLEKPDILSPLISGAALTFFTVEG
jgi:hypothetical protein